jgi:uncharacterized protein (TIGR00369 family)
MTTAAAKGAVKVPPERTGTGLEFLKRIIAGEIPNVPMADHLGFRLVEVEPGYIAILGRPDLRSYNLLGSVHGGWAASILDTALALSALSTLDEKNGHTTLDIRINYLRPITLENGELRAEGRVIQGGRRVAYCEAKLVDGNGKLLAHGTGSCLIFPRG